MATRNPYNKALDPEQVFEILERLEELDTCYGTMYKAVDKRNGQLVLLQIIDGADRIPRIIKLKQIHTLNCPQVARCYDDEYSTPVKDDQRWISLEYCYPGSLRQMMVVTEQHLQEEQIQLVMHHLLTAVDYLHSKGITGLEIKADNIWIDASLSGLSAQHSLQKTELVVRGYVRQQSEEYNLYIPAEFIPILLHFYPRDITVKLSGLFDQDQYLESSWSRGYSSRLPVPYWMAPEVISEQKRSSKEDIWSLGITAIELATGNPPHADISPFRCLFMIPKNDAPRLPEPDGDDNQWSNGFRSFVAQCLAKDPEQRKSAKQLLLHEWIQQSKGNYVLDEWVDTAIQKLEEPPNEESDPYDDDAYGQLMIDPDMYDENADADAAQYMYDEDDDPYSGGTIVLHDDTD